MMGCRSLTSRDASSVTPRNYRTKPSLNRSVLRPSGRSGYFLDEESIFLKEGGRLLPHRVERADALYLVRDACAWQRPARLISDLIDDFTKSRVLLLLLQR